MINPFPKWDLSEFTAHSSKSDRKLWQFFFSEPQYTRKQTAYDFLHYCPFVREIHWLQRNQTYNGTLSMSLWVRSFLWEWHVVTNKFVFCITHPILICLTNAHIHRAGTHAQGCGVSRAWLAHGGSKCIRVLVSRTAFTVSPIEICAWWTWHWKRVRTDWKLGSKLWLVT